MPDGGEKAGDAVARFEKKLDVVVGREAEEERDSPFLIARGLAMLGFMGSSVSFCSRTGTVHPVQGAILLAVAIAASVVATKAPPRKMKLKTRSTNVRVTDATLTCDGKTIPRPGIAAAAFHAGERPMVRCHDVDGKILVEALVANEEEGRELLRAIGLEAKKRTSFPVASPLGSTILRRLAMMVGGYGLIFAYFAAMPKVSWFTFLALGMMVFILPRFFMSVPAFVEIGSDGLLVRWLGTKRFVPFDAMERIEKYGSMLKIHRTKGPAVLLNPVADADHLEALIERIEAARRARTLPGPRVDLESRLGRGHRTVEQWRKELAEIEGHDGYRDAGMRRDDLWHIVEDASAPDDARMAAALLLREEDAPRIRVAADAVASPKLRIALEKAADLETDDAELDERIQAATTASS